MKGNGMAGSHIEIKVDAEIRAATVWLPTREGQGVLVNGDVILTAAHCIEWSPDFIDASCLGDPIRQFIETKDGRKFRGDVVFIDPIADIAAIQCCDAEQCLKDAAAFENFCRSTTATTLSGLKPDLFTLFPVNILAHTGEWIAGNGQFCNPGRSNVFIQPFHRIRGGTSGGPVLDINGELLGVVSVVADSDDGEIDGAATIPFAIRTLPRWLIEKIESAANSED